MIARLLVLAAAAVCVASPVGAQQRGARTCRIRVDSTGGGSQFIRMADGSQNVFSGGGVLVSCLNDSSTTINSDSMAYFESRGLLEFIGNVHFRDSTNLLDADKVTYWTRQERLYAEGHVYSRSLSSGSEMRGPNLDYYRAVPPIRDTIELVATGRPTIIVVPQRDTTDSVFFRKRREDAFVVVADRVRMRHTDRMWGSGNVTINRPDLDARSDSAFLNLADSVGHLIGAAQVIGHDTVRSTGDTTAFRLRRPAARDTTAQYRLVGQRIRFDLGPHEQIKRALSSGDADAFGPDWRLTADTLDLTLDSGQIQRAQAWGRNTTPVALSGLSRITADSLDIQMPGQVMRLVWAYGNGRATSKPDSTVTESDWLSGDTLRATFAAMDSAGKQRAEIDRVTAFSTARAYYHTDNQNDPHGERGINYSRGDRITIVMRERKVRTVDIVGRVDGVYLEPLPAGWDSAGTDTTTVRPERTRRTLPTPDGGAPAPPRPAPASGSATPAAARQTTRR